MGIEARREIQDQKSNNKSRDLDYNLEAEEEITNSKTNLSDEIIKLEELKNKGLLSDEEYKQAKKKLLS